MLVGHDALQAFFSRVYSFRWSRLRKVFGQASLFNVKYPGHQGGPQGSGELGVRRDKNFSAALGGKGGRQGMILGGCAGKDQFALQRPVFYGFAQIIAGRRVGQAGQLRFQGQAPGSSGNQGRLGQQGTGIPQVDGVVRPKAFCENSSFILTPRSSARFSRKVPVPAAQMGSYCSQKGRRF
jgi:hypothetical protein